MLVPGMNYRADDILGGSHTFQIIWKFDQIIWLVDGRIIWNITEYEKISYREAYVSMWLGIGEQWTGVPDITTMLPTRMVIDYVSVNQWK
jgi:beta-glucanase (GH16 family)